MRPGVAAHDECVALIANTDDLLDQVFRLRYQVYCVERGFLAGEDGRESDGFDPMACHILLKHRPTGQPIGTVRVVPSSATLGVSGLPMARLCPLTLLRGFPNLTTGEISRFAVSKERRISCRVGPTIRLDLIQGIVRASAALGLTHWIAIMEPTLRRLLQADGIHFEALGDMVEYHGLRQPLGLALDSMLERLRVENFEVWNHTTLGGTLWPRKVVS